MTKPEPPRSAADELERLRQQNAYKTQLLNSVAHELSTPLTPIRLQLHLLRHSPPGSLSPENRSAIEIVERNVERLHGLLQDVLDVARLESSRLTVELKPVDLSEVVEESLAAYREPARAAGVALESSATKGVVVAADARRLIQVLYNLIANAIKFTASGGRVTVRVIRSDGEALVTVHDTGVGFPSEDQARLFKPFSQLDSPVEGAFEGAGLGLYISRGIVELHGGRIWGESPGRGKGATFGFALPVAVAAVPARPPATRAVLTPSATREEEFARRVRNLI